MLLCFNPCGLFILQRFPYHPDGVVSDTDPIQRFLAKEPYDVGKHEGCILLAGGLKKMRHETTKENQD